ncbi:hypothetical protein AAF712_005494 [Marasmius tenuissimus]|uniref:Pentatricopeptide repeat-containing protein n=1 Tax=Marasmius tenuissimus TaxID=585030 RepID=A0ABR3A3A5_9AGAR
MSSLQRFLMFVPSSRQSTATDFIRSRLKEKRIRKSTITRQIVLEKVIGLLAHNRRYAEASKVYKQMVEEKYDPSPIVDAQMLVIGLASGAVKPEKAMDGLTRIFQVRGENGTGAGEFSENEFVRLLGLSKALELPPRLIVHTIRKFISYGGKDYIPSPVIVNLLVGMLVRDGMVDEAFRVIAHYDIDSDQTDICSEDADVSIEIDTDADIESIASSRTQPYATLISSLPSFDPLSQGTIDRVLRTIRYNEIRIDSALFSALISHYASSRDVKKTMALYEALGKARQETGISELQPNASVYSSLWDLISWSWLQHHKAEKHRNRKSPPPSSTSRNRSSRAPPKPSDAFHATPQPPVRPRLLFADMIRFMFISEDGSSRNTNISSNTAQSLLNTSLRSFITAGDYAGAIVLLETLVEKLGVRASGRTYATVINGLRTRFQRDATSARLLLGVEPTDGESVDTTHIQGEGASERWITTLLNQSRRDLDGDGEISCYSSSKPAASPSSSPSSSSPPRRTLWHGRVREVRKSIPTLSMVQGTRAVPPTVELSAEPLVWMLIRATCVLGRRKNGRVKLGGSTVEMFPRAALRGIEIQVNEARLRMIPTDLADVLGRMKVKK